MNKKIGRVTTVLAALGMLAISGVAMATNGYFTHGVGTESKGMAGTGIGSNAANGPIVTASNPALSYFADDGWEVGLSFFSPMRSYEASSSLAMGQGGAFTVDEAKIDSSSEWFPIPYVAKNWRLSNGHVIGTAFYGRGGMNTDWDDSNTFATFDPDGDGPTPIVSPSGPFGDGEAGVDLSQAFLAVNYSAKIGDNFAIGIGPIFAIQMFEAKGVGTFAGYTKTFNTVYPGYVGACVQAGGNPLLCQLQALEPAAGDVTSLTDNGHELSTGFGGAAGFWWGVTDSFSVGASYTSKMSMSEFDDYSDLFAEAGGFDIPSSTKLGFTFGRGTNVLVNFDVEQTQFSEVDSVGNPLANIAGCPSAGLGGTDVESCLGGKNGAGFGWDDMTTYKLGVEWTVDDSTVWRFGYSYGKQPINEADVLFNILAPGVMEEHITLGLTRDKWHFSLMYAPPFSVKGQNLFDPTQEIELTMRQLEFEVAYSF